MAEFLDTQDTNFFLQQTIRQAAQHIVILSPYVKINAQFRAFLQAKAKSQAKLDIRIVYGKEETLDNERDWLPDCPGVRTFHCLNMHAKCYLNEEQAIVTSMNFHSYAQQNNWEMGILVHRDQDPNLFNQIREGVREILLDSDERTFRDSNKPTKESRIPVGMQIQPKQAPTRPMVGFCIRCTKQLKPPDPRHPYCITCFRVWEQHRNSWYREKICYFCGQDNPSTIDKPCCFPCFKKYYRMFKFTIETAYHGPPHYG